MDRNRSSAPRRSRGRTPAEATPYTDPHWERTAVITIDLQVDVREGGPLEIRGTSRILPAVRHLLRAARRAGRPIVHVVRLYQPDGSNVDLCRRARVEAGWEVLRPGTPGCELLPEVLRTPETRLDPSRLLAGELQPLGAHEWALYKPRWGAFFATRLDPHLRALQADTLVFAGSNYPNCPRASIYEASERDYRIVVVTDGVSGLDWRGGRELAAIGVALRTSDQVSEAWRDGAPIRRPRERHGAR